MVPLLLAGCTGLPDELARPNRVALAADGTLYVSDFHHDRVVVFGPDGRYLSSFGTPGIGRDQLWRVTAMTLTPSGSLVVANRRPESDAEDADVATELKEFVDGREVGRIALDGRVLPEDGWVDDVAPGPDGTFLLADSTHGELTLVDHLGNRVGRFGGIPRVDAAPSAIVPDGDAYWVIEQHRHRIQRLTRDGVDRLLLLQDEGNGPPRFPTALAVCRDEWFAVTDLGNHRVQRYTLDGVWIGGFTPEPAGPDHPVQLLDIAMTEDCSRLYLVDSKGDRVLVTQPDGRVVFTIDRW